MRITIPTVVALLAGLAAAAAAEEAKASVVTISSDSKGKGKDEKKGVEHKVCFLWLCGFGWS